VSNNKKGIISYSAVTKFVKSFAGRLRSSEMTIGFILAILVGVISGLGAVAFRWMIENCQALFFDKGGQIFSFLGDYYIIVIPAIGGLIVGLLIYFLAREAKGHGVPEVMEAVALKGGRIRARVSIVKALASSICIGSGGSVGREGPIVQIGASFGSTIGQWLKLPDETIKTLVACGAAGGISATFNSPIAGVLFALEVILGRVVSPKFAYIVMSSVIADFMAHAFLGNERAFTVPEFGIESPWEMIIYVILGICAAFVAVAFTKILYRSEDIFEKVKIPDYIKPVIGGIIIGCIGLYSRDLFGVGYGGIEKALTGQIALSGLGMMLLLKVAATSVTIGSGGSGGVFAPSLFIGVMLGGVLGSISAIILPDITGPVGGYGIVGMAAVFAAAAGAPFSAILIVFEMTGDYAIILPLMMAVGISVILSRRISRENIYTTKLLRRGVDIRGQEIADVMKTIPVEQVMTTKYLTVPTTMSIKNLIEWFRRRHYNGFPVIDAEQRLYGVVTLSDLERVLQKESQDGTVADIATRSIFVAYPDQSLEEVLGKAIGNYSCIPVVSRDDKRKLIGVLQRQDMVKAYRNKVAEIKK